MYVIEAKHLFDSRIQIFGKSPYNFCQYPRDIYIEASVRKVMKPEDIHGMMEEMMSKMFSGMSVEQRVQFCSAMMPKCLSKVFAGVSPEEKEKFKKEMVDKMMSMFEQL